MTGNGESIREYKLEQLKKDCEACGKSIPEMCNGHAQTQRDIGLVNVRIDKTEDRLTKLEKTRDEKLDMIIDML